jgi:hypothetical protein
MTEFELLAIPLSLILGLGITHILTGVTEAVRDREHVALHWLPLFWAFLIFLFQVQYFFVIWDIEEDGIVWSWPIFGPALFNCIILFVAAGLVLPRGRRTDCETLLEDFEKHGRLSLITIAIMLVVAILLNVFHVSGTLWSLANALNVILIAAVVLILATRRLRWQVLATFIFALVEFYGLLAVWSVPGG